MIKTRLDASGAKPSMLGNVAQQGGAAVTGAVVNAAPDTAGKMAIRPARLSRILEQEHAAAEKLSDLLWRVASHDLHQLGVVA